MSYFFIFQILDFVCVQIFMQSKAILKDTSIKFYADKGVITLTAKLNNLTITNLYITLYQKSM